MSRPSVSPAMVVALIALVVALGGTGYAVTQLPKNSVGTAQIKNNAVTAAKVKDGSLTARDFRPGTLLQGATGATGAAGAQGPAGATGGRGPSDGYFASADSTVTLSPDGAVKTAGSITLPPGKYLATAAVIVDTQLAITGQVRADAFVQTFCEFPAGRPGSQERLLERSFDNPGSLGNLYLDQTMVIQAFADLSGASGPTALKVDCFKVSIEGAPFVTVSSPSLSAIKVETLTQIQSGP